MLHLTNWQRVNDSDWRRLVSAARKHFTAGKTWTNRSRGRSLALLFFNPSLRTRTSMEVAGAQLGAHVTTLNAGDAWDFEWKQGAVMDGPEAEHIREAVGVLSRYYDALGVRVFASGDDYERDRGEVMLQTIVAASTVPVINLESAFYHPCQALSDAATVATYFEGEPDGRNLALSWTHHPKALPMAVPNSTLLMAARLGMNVIVARPDEYALDDEITNTARRYAGLHGASLDETNDIEAAMENADIVYAKSWGGRLSYTDPVREAKLRRQYCDWRITEARMALTRDAKFMHCLPVRRGVVVDDSVLDGPDSLHLMQAEFRLYAQKAILEYLWK